MIYAVSALTWFVIMFFNPDHYDFYDFVMNLSLLRKIFFCLEWLMTI